MTTYHGTTLWALGTTARVVVADPAVLATAEMIMRTEVAAIDAACSRFRDDSELSRVNGAEGEEVEVSPLMLESLEIALAAARRTGGLVSPAVGEAVIAAGYDRTFSELRVPGRRRVRVRGVPDWRDIRVDHARSTVRVPKGMLLDLGATAKSHAADRAAGCVSAVTGTGCLVSLGGDVALGGNAPPGGWPVRITDDHAHWERADGPVIALHVGGCASSSVSVRQWQMPEGLAHHVMDPRTGGPAEVVWQTTSVAAPDCVTANTASLAALILGHDAPAWLTHRGLPARLVGRDGQIRHVGGWPEEEA